MPKYSRVNMKYMLAPATRAEIERDFSSLLRRECDISRGSKHLPIYNFEVFLDGNSPRRDPFFHPENPAVGDKFSCRRRRASFPINCLYRMKFRVASRRVRASRRKNLQPSELLGCEVYRKCITRAGTNHHPYPRLPLDII